MLLAEPNVSVDCFFSCRLLVSGISHHRIMCHRLVPDIVVSLSKQLLGNAFVFSVDSHLVWVWSSRIKGVVVVPCPYFLWVWVLYAIALDDVEVVVGLVFFEGFVLLND